MVPFADAFNHATPGVNHCHLEVSDLGLSAVGLVHLYLPIYLSVYPSLSFCLSLSLSISLSLSLALSLPLQTEILSTYIFNIYIHV